MMRRDPSRWRSYKIHDHCHPLVKELFREINRQRISVPEIAKRAGITPTSILQWRTKYTPNVANLDACFNVLGRKLKVG
jgi:transcriptional regulator with XRE-family HTH domain